MRAKKIAIIAGNGELPVLLVNTLKQQNIQPFLIGFYGQTNPALKSHNPALWVRLGQTGKVLKSLRRQNIDTLIMIGAMKRPKVWEICPDWKTLEFYFSLGIDKKGDDSFLKKLDEYLAKHNLKIIGAHEFLDAYLTPEGIIGKYKPKAAQKKSITLGIAESQKLGTADIGQSIVVQSDQIIAQEGKDGTDALIARGAQMANPSLPPPILVKTCKPQQDKRFDLPTIGVHTVQNCANHGYAGIVIHAGASFLIDKETVAQTADMHKMFVMGISI